VPSDDPLLPTPPFDRVHDVDAELPGRPVVRLMNLITSECVLSGFERIRMGPDPDSKGIPIRFGHGNEWRDVMILPRAAHAPLVNRVKVMANLDITRHVTQRGELRVQLRGVEHVLEVVVTPVDAGVEEILLTRADTSRTAGPSA
jgi:type IV pilus assembly protein PilB